MLALLAVTALAIVALRGGGRRWRRAGRFALALALVGVAWFQLGWGLLYGRSPVERSMALPAVAGAEAADRTLALLTAIVVENADAEPDIDRAVAATSSAVADLAERLGSARPTVPSRVRALPPGTLLRVGSAGVVSPFTLEAHVDGGLPPAAFAAVAAHELAHLAGFAREADAELIGALAALGSEAPFARYAAALAQGARLASRLDLEQRGAWLASLPPRARDDLDAVAAAVDRYRIPALAGPAAALYDRYLKAQGVVAGGGDYDRSAALLVRAEAGGWLEAPPAETP